MEILTAFVASKEFAAAALFFVLDGTREVIIFAGIHRKVIAWYRAKRVNHARMILKEYRKGGK
jgi:hypothetical protein